MSPRRAKATLGRVGDDPATALRGHLIDTAERLLAEHQVGQLTTRQIARAAGVSDGVLYNYFADKNDLLVAALLSRYGRLLGSYDAKLPEAGTATVETNLVAYAEAALELVAQALPIAAGLMTEPHLLHRFVADIHREPFGPQRLREPLAAYLTAEQRLGRLADVPMGAALTLILGPVIMLGFTELVGGQPREVVSAQLPGIVRTLLTGLNP
ncbi:MAG: TetR/AcrR family transcriptional regulator [Hamadaea sp.]|uniref:TetR/AcrR family transcriptional regulator n=1 Tax=Hamadaea sp. TaxID=2024425 RepID=UPI0017D17861|nr:TetR/AcrR family transcriptional regulator [Hamadaea sp.]NUR72864.1 TetR/AcrR family transcriptional regulator [Hamadaea sp.]NUT20854.1 TetR/AcrR family transcriptional regulator [Hamadaea sp.]